MKFVENIKINSHDADYNDIIRPSAVISYMQEAANLQVNTFGPTYIELLRDNKAFMVSRLAVKFIEPLHKYEEIQSESWPADSTGFTFNRFHRLYRDGALVCEAHSCWALVDIETRRPCRTNEYHANFETHEMIDIGVPLRARLPKTEEMDMCGEHTISYSETDINRHCNNARYADILCDFIDMTGKRVKELLLSFCTEAPIHEKLTIYKKQTDENVYMFRTVRSDGKTNVEAVITLTDI